MKKLTFGLLMGITSLLVTQFASAALIMCGSAQRMAELDSATSCSTGLGNPQDTDLNTYFGPSWSRVAEETSGGNSSYLFDVSLTSGSWGGGDAGGTWTIHSDFWATYGDAAISMHVGNGGGDPDHFVWLIVDGETSGTWAYDFKSGGGGGLSNLQLWGRGEGTTVPEPGTIALLGIGIVGLSLCRKKVA